MVTKGLDRLLFITHTERQKFVDINQVVQIGKEVFAELRPRFEKYDTVATAIKDAGANLEDKTQLPAAQIDVFLNSELFRTAREMESPDAEITDQEATLLQSVNEKLLQPDFNSNAVFASILAVKREAMLDVGVEDPRITGELQHVSDVVSLYARIEPQNMVGQLIVMGHDMYKQRRARPNESGTELALHELVSTELGSDVLVAVLEKTHPVLFTQAELDVIKKLARRATFTHGAGEFPEMNSREVDAWVVDEQTRQKFAGADVQIPRLLFGSLYYKPKKRAVPASSSGMQSQAVSTKDIQSGIDGITPRQFVDRTIALLNTADALTGNEWFSFIKYNLFYPNRVLIEHYLTEAEAAMQSLPTERIDKPNPAADYRAVRAQIAGKALQRYFTTHLTASYEGNLQVDSLNSLQNSPQANHNTTH